MLTNEEKVVNDLTNDEKRALVKFHIAERKDALYLGDESRAEWHRERANQYKAVVEA